MIKKKTIFAIIAICLVTSPLFALALSQWSRSFTGSISNASFDVQSPLGTSISSDQNIVLGIANNGDEFTYDYYVVNDGNVPIIVVVSEGTPTNCIVAWSTTSETIAVGANAQYTLTLTVSGSPGDDFSYSFSFGLA